MAKKPLIISSGKKTETQLGAVDVAFSPVTDIVATDTQAAIEAHGLRHRPTGPDAIPTAAAITLLPDQTNLTGGSTSLARSNHRHNVPTAVAVTISTNGVNAQGDAASFARSNHTHKSEIYYLNAQVTGLTTTTSAADVLLDSMTLTPPAGTYHVYFQTSVQRNQNLGEAYFSCYVGGVKQTGSEVHFITGSGGSARDTKGVINIVGFPVTVNGSQAIDIRWRQVGGGDAESSPARSLTVVRVD